MEAFEVTQKGAKRQRSRPKSKAGYILTMAGMILFTSAFLVVLHFMRKYSTEDGMKIEASFAEKLEGEAERCKEEPFCNSKECVYVAATMLEAMNPDIDPCSDFYAYACGRYSRVKELPYAMDFYSPLKDAQNKILIDIRKTMDAVHNRTQDDVKGHLTEFYKLCMDSEGRNNKQNDSLQFLFEYLGVSPNLDQSYQWPDLLSRLEDKGIHTIFSPRFVAKEGSAPEKMEIGCSIPFLKPQAYLNTSDSELAFQMILYRDELSEALQLLHVDVQGRQEFINEVIQVESSIAASLMNANDSPGSVTPLTEENKELLKRIWRPILQQSMDELEIVSTCKYDLQKIMDVLRQSTDTSVSKYIFWRAILQLMLYLGPNFNDLHLHYSSKLPGTDYALNYKWKQCSDIVRTQFGMITADMLMENGYLKRETIDAVNEQFLETKRDIALIFSATEELDAAISKKLLEKLKSMQLVMRSSDVLNRNEINWNKAYSDWNLVKGDYFKSVIALKEFQWWYHLQRLWHSTNASFLRDKGFKYHPIRGISLDDNPLDTTIRYDYETNTVYADLGLFIPPVYLHSENIPSYLNAGYSSILVREMIRAFDFKGIFYDADGQRFEKILWPAYMERMYDDAINCLRNQTGRLKSARRLNLDNMETLNNIVSDFRSFSVPFEGLKTHLRSHLDEKPLPGMGVTANKKQTFFVQVAQTFCEIKRSSFPHPEAETTRLPPKDRVNFAVASMEDFADVFHCPPGSPMISGVKCIL